MAKFCLALFILSQSLCASVATNLRCQKFKAVFDQFSEVTKESAAHFTTEELAGKDPIRNLLSKK